MDQIFLSIVIPAYNEEQNFHARVLSAVDDFIRTAPWRAEVVLVDDGSSDQTAALLEKYAAGKAAFRLLKQPHGGKISAVKGGVEISRGDYILFTDFDQSTPITEVAKMLPFLQKDYDVAIGSREVAGAVRIDEPLYRHVMGRWFNWAVRLLAVPRYCDTQCGFKLFRATVARDLFGSLHVCRPREILNPFTGAFDVELLVIAKARGYRVAEIPVRWTYAATSRVDPFKDSFKMLWEIARISWNLRRGVYGEVKIGANSKDA